MFKGKNFLLLASLLLIISGLAAIFLSINQVNPSFQAEVTPTPSVVKESTPSSTLGVGGEEVTVTRVIDGDTIEIEGAVKVRLIGIDTPETVDPRRPVGCFGKEASSETRRLVEGKSIFLVKDISETDRFGRLLRYVYLKDDSRMVFINDHLVRQGFARASTFPPDVKFTDQLQKAEKEARENQRGLWSNCPAG